MSTVYAAFFAWIDTLDEKTKTAVQTKWRVLCEGRDATSARRDWISVCERDYGFRRPVELGEAPPPPRLSFLQSLINAHPKFRAWLDGQPQAVKNAAQGQWNILLDHPDIVWDHHHAETARLSFLMKWCSEEYGYDFSP